MESSYSAAEQMSTAPVFSFTWFSFSCPYLVTGMVELLKGLLCGHLCHMPVLEDSALIT